MKNRLQFAHRDKLYDNREQILQLLSVDTEFRHIRKPSLYGEPIVFRYRSDDELRPNIILAIGSSGNGESNECKYFPIDIAGMDEKFDSYSAETDERLAQLVNVFQNTDSISFTDSPNENGGHDITASVKLATDVHSNNPNRITESVANIIKVQNDGIYSYVHVDFDDKTNTFTFRVNDDSKVVTIATITSGEYDSKSQSIIFHQKGGDDITVDMTPVIDEWKTYEGTDTPIVLSKENHRSKDDSEDNRKDILKATVRLSKDADNILKETATTEGNALYVKGTADNIKYKDSNVAATLDKNIGDIQSAQYALGDTYKSTDGHIGDKAVDKRLDNLEKGSQDTASAINTINTDISSLRASSYFTVANTDTVKLQKDETPAHTVTANVQLAENAENILSKDKNGIHASIGYNKDRNALIVSSQTGGTREIQLGTNNIVQHANYDPSTEDLVIVFAGDGAEVDRTTRIKVTDLITEWSVTNENHTVTLVRDHVVNGKDQLTADVNLANDGKYADNAIQVVGNALYVSKDDIIGSAQAIADKAKSEAINSAKEQADAANDTLSTILKSYTDGKVQENTNKITAEETNRQKGDESLSSAIDDMNAVIGKNVFDKGQGNTISEKYTALSNKVDKNAQSITANTLAHEELKQQVNTNTQDISTNASAIARLTASTSANADEISKIKTDAITLSADTRDAATGLSRTYTDGEISTVRGELTTAITSARTDQSNADNALSERINTITDNVSGLRTSLNDEIRNRENTDNNLTAETTNRITADTALKTSINQETADRESAVSGLQSQLDKEKTAREEKDANLNNGIAAETSARKDADNQLSKDIQEAITTAANDAESKDKTVKLDLQTLIDSKTKAITISVEDTDTVDLDLASKGDGNGQSLKADVKLSTATNNILKADNAGLYAATSVLSYNSATNVLTFTNGLNKSTEIKLNSASFINKASYDANGHNLIITYTDKDGNEQTVTVALEGLIKDTDVKNDGSVITLHKEVTDVNNISTNIITADVNVADNVDGNILKKVTVGNNGHALIADATQIKAAIAANSQAITDLQPKVDRGSSAYTRAEEVNDRLTNLIQSVGTGTEGHLNNVVEGDGEGANAYLKLAADDKTTNTILKMIYTLANKLYELSGQTNSSLNELSAKTVTAITADENGIHAIKTDNTKGSTISLDSQSDESHNVKLTANGNKIQGNVINYESGSFSN